MNPIEILYSWQAVLIAVAATGITQLVKTLVDIWWGSRVLKRASTPPPAAEPKPITPPAGPYRTPTPPAVKPSAVAVGKEQRKRSVIINRLVLPMTPIVVGALFAVLVPARPEVIMEYVTTHEVGWTKYLIFAAWGAACGQFADYLWSKVKATFDTMRGGASPAPAPKAAAEHEESEPGEGNEG